MKNALYPFLEEWIREFYSNPIQFIGFIMCVIGFILFITIGGYLLFTNVPFLVALAVVSVVMIFFGAVMACD